MCLMLYRPQPNILLTQLVKMGSAHEPEDKIAKGWQIAVPEEFQENIGCNW